MMHLKHENKITFFVVSTFIAQPLLSIMAAVIYPPDFSKEFPVYDPNSIMLIVCGNALGIAGLLYWGLNLLMKKKFYRRQVLQCWRSLRYFACLHV